MFALLWLGLVGGVWLSPLRAVEGALYWTSPRSPNISDVCHGGDRFVAVGGYGNVYWSTDGMLWYAADSGYSGTYTHLRGVCYGNGWFIAVGQDGTILRSLDGKTWSSCISPTTSTLSSVWAANGRFVAVGAGAKILVSSDGYLWSAVGYINNGVGPYALGDLCSVVAGNGIWVAMESSNTTGVWSADGVTWTRMYTGAGYEKHLIFDGTRFVAVSGGGSQSSLLTSSDGVTWQVRRTPAELLGIAHSGGRYVATDNQGLLRTSTDLETWTTVASASGLRRIVFGDGKFAGLGNGCRASSADGLSWEVRSSGGASFSLKASCSFGSKRYVAGDDGSLLVYDHGYDALLPLASGVEADLKDIASNGSSVVAVGEGGAVLRSSDGVSWNLVNGKTTATLLKIIPARGGYCAVGGGGALIYSADGITWTRAVTGVTAEILAVADSGTLAVASTVAGDILFSSDLVNWAKVAGPSDRLYEMAYGNGVYVATGYYGAVWYSADGTTWEARSSGYAGWTAGIAFGEGRFVLLSQNGYVRTSTDGMLWKGGRTGMEAWGYLRGIGFGDGRFFGVGDYRQVVFSSRSQPMDRFRPALRRQEDGSLDFHMEDGADGYVFDIEQSGDLMRWETVARDRTTMNSNIIHRHVPAPGETRVFYRARLSGSP